MNTFLRLGLAALVSLAATTLLTAITIHLANRFGWVARPRKDRWHKKPTALFGGIAIWLGFIIAVLPFVAFVRESQYIGVLVGGTLMFATGLLDDLIEIKPSSKILAQLVSAAIMILFGVRVLMVVDIWIAIPLTLLWFIGITNAFNLLDNMDGLSSGIACIASGFVIAVSMANGNYEVAIMAAALMGACAGFLIFNFHPAKIFMGDGGALFIGFSLASMSLVGTWEHASNLFLVMAIPVLVLAVPIFDTTLVTITRKLQGRPISQGGKDHSSHRLVALGASEPRAVITLWLVAAVLGSIALSGLYLHILPTVMLIGLGIVVLAIFGIYLGAQKIYVPTSKRDSEQTLLSPRLTRLKNAIFYKRRIMEVLVDTFLVILALVSAYLLRFEGRLEPVYEQLGIFLPLAIVIKLTTFFFVGLYRSVWRYISVHDLIVIIKGITLGSVSLIIVVLMLTRFAGISRTVFVLDFLLSLVFVGGVRILFRIFRESLELSSHDSDTLRTLIVGAGDAGELLVREIRQNKDLHFSVIGFIDDDPLKQKAIIHGVPVCGDQTHLRNVVNQKGIQHVLIAMPSAPENVKTQYRELCAQIPVPYSTIELAKTPSVIALDPDKFEEKDASP